MTTAPSDPARSACRRLATVVAGFVAITVAALPAVASAHEVGSSALLLTVSADGRSVTGTLEIPLDRLDLARGTDYAAHPDGVAADATELRAYVADHLSVADAEGALDETIGTPTVADVDGVAHLVVPLAYTGGAGGSLTVASDVVVEMLRSHRILVTGGAEGRQVLVGTLDLGTPSLALPTASGSTSGVLTAVRLGFDHVRTGLDHLLFVATLLLCAPMVADRRRWSRRRASTGRALRQVVHTASAFTLAHSITLIAASRGWVVAPSRPVEVLIAISIVVAAVNVVRPILPGTRALRADVLVAFCFGLAHGLAFAGITRSLGLTAGTGLWTLLGFNLGVELAQLAVIALVLPSLLAISTTVHYRRVATVLAVGIGGVALSWAISRSFGARAWVTPLEDAVVAHPFVSVALLAVVAATLVLRSSVRRSTREPVGSLP